MDTKALVAQMTLEEKASLCSGMGFWLTKPIPRLNIPSVWVSDGPHGLRKQAGEGDHLGLNDSIVATCFPTAAALACSFDRELLFSMGEALGEECQAENISVVLGPGANIKRSPLCGRNFEYFSEDPLLSGEMAAALIRGVQSKNVGTSLKHFAVNNQETRRMSVDVRVDERALREIYLASFEHAVKRGRPWTVMCAYNKLDGVYGSENPFLLTQVLRNEWGFDGYTVTDWGACADHVKGVAAGLDLEMPSLGTGSDKMLVEAVRAGKIDETIVDRAVTRILNICYRYLENRDEAAVYDREAHHHTARRIARETMVLLKNDGGVLPLSGESVAFIGQFAVRPRYQGTGSSRVNASHVLGALEAVRSVAKVAYAQGYDDSTDAIDQALIDEAVRAARAAEVAVLFVGLPDTYESEGFDRTHMRLPDNQLALIDAVTRVNAKTVIVLHGGSAVEMPWADDVAAILNVYLGGQAVGGAAVDVLYGAWNPSGKLAETIPMRLADTPCYTSFPGDGDFVAYHESIYVGYRHYDTRDMAVRYPFGHGLSYTTFAYGNLTVDHDTIAPDGTLIVSVDVTNTGGVAGKEAVQLYVRGAHKGISRPAQELRAFDKVALEAGETKTVRFTLDSRAFAYWEPRIHGWYVESGAYDVLIGASSRDIRQSARVTVTENKPLPVPVTPDTPLGDLLTLPGGREILAPLFAAFGGIAGDPEKMDPATAALMEAAVRELPLHALRNMAGDAFPDAAMRQVIAALGGMA